MASVVSLVYVLPHVNAKLYSRYCLTYNVDFFTGGTGRGYWKIHVYSGLSHLPDLLFGGIVSYGGTLVSLGSAMRDDKVTLAKGVACMLCVKQLTKRNERVTKGENILR